MASLPPKNTGGGYGNSGSGKKSFFNIIGSPTYTSGKVTYTFEMYSKVSSCCIELMVVTDFKKLKASAWENKDEIGKKFPLSFLEFAITDYKKNVKSAVLTECNVAVDEQTDTADCDKFTIRKINSKDFGVPSSIRIDFKENDIVIHGVLSFCSEDPGLKGVFEFKEVQ